jgi:hypothetical protein
VNGEALHDVKFGSFGPYKLSPQHAGFRHSRRKPPKVSCGVPALHLRYQLWHCSNEVIAIQLIRCPRHCHDLNQSQSQSFKFSLKKTMRNDVPLNECLRNCKGINQTRHQEVKVALFQRHGLSASRTPQVHNHEAEPAKPLASGGSSQGSSLRDTSTGKGAATRRFSSSNARPFNIHKGDSSW